MAANLVSYMAVTPLLVILITALFGMNDVRTHRLRHLTSPQGFIESALGLSFLATFAGSGLMIYGVVTGGNLYSWRGLILMTGIAGIFVLAGLYMPWKRWIRSLPDRRAAAAARLAAREASAA